MNLKGLQVGLSVESISGDISSLKLGPQLELAAPSREEAESA
jgi:hypothetical protein